MGRIPLGLADTGGIFKSYPLEIADVAAMEDTSLDVKYYDPNTLEFMKQLKDTGARSLGQLSGESIHRGKSPAKAEYNVGADSNIRVVKAGNIDRVGLTENLTELTIRFTSG